MYSYSKRSFASRRIHYTLEIKELRLSHGGWRQWQLTRDSLNSREF
jgi:hypothetical protein